MDRIFPASLLAAACHYPFVPRAGFFVPLQMVLYPAMALQGSSRGADRLQLTV